MSTAKIEQLRKDIASLKAAEEVRKRNFVMDFHCFGWISTLEDELKSLENSAVPAEVVRVFQLKLGDLIFNSAQFERISEILVERRPGGMTHIKAGSNSYTLRHDSLVVRKLEAKPCD